MSTSTTTAAAIFTCLTPCSIYTPQFTNTTSVVTYLALIVGFASRAAVLFTTLTIPPIVAYTTRRYIELTALFAAWSTLVKTLFSRPHVLTSFFTRTVVMITNSSIFTVSWTFCTCQICYPVKSFRATCTRIIRGTRGTVCLAFQAVTGRVIVVIATFAS